MRLVEVVILFLFSYTIYGVTISVCYVFTHWQNNELM